MRIGIDARFFGPKGKGLGRYTQKLIENLEKIDKQNQYIIFLRQENWDDYQPATPNFKKAMANYRWYSLVEQILMPFKIYQQKIELMHFPHFNVPILYFGLFVVTVHDLILRHFKTRRASTLGPLKYWLKNLAYRIIIWIAVKRAKKIFVPSHYVKKDIIETFDIGDSKVEVTYEGAPVQFLNKINPPSPSFMKGGSAPLLGRERLGGILDSITKPYLLYVGNAYPHKNLERLIKAFEILVEQKGQDLQLVLVGEMDYFYQRLKKYVTEKFSQLVSRVIFTDFVTDEELAMLYSKAALYVFPSLCEGFGLPPLEAMAYGVPVVSSGATCLPEILDNAAIYFNAENPQDIAEKINKFLTDKILTQKIIAAGYEQIKKYSWQKMAEKTLNVYQNLGSMK